MISLTQARQEFHQTLVDLLDQTYIFNAIVDLVAKPTMPLDEGLVRAASVVQLLETADRVYKTGTWDGIHAISYEGQVPEDSVLTPAEEDPDDI